MILEYIDITPHKTIMEKIAKTGYTIEDALAELIDNSIDAKQEAEKLVINLVINKEKIIVEDNGSGMSKEIMANAIKLGFSTKKGKLGEFGLGLKTSALSLSKKFTIITTTKEKNEEYQITFDLNEWLQEGSWVKHPLAVNEKRSMPESGTKIILEKLKLNPENKVDEILNHLSLRFGPFINMNLLTININGNLCLPKEIKLIDNKKNYFNLNLKENIKVKGWWGYQIAGHLKNYYGFNTFRRNRLITTYDKIGLSESQQAKQIVGELYLEGVPVTHDKRNWLRESSEFKEVIKAVKDLLSRKDKKLVKLISGNTANPGKVEGKVRVIKSFIGRDIEDLNLEEGEILVTEMTRPDLLLAIRKAGAIITDLGGVTCHAAIVSREFNIPCIVGTDNATTTLKNGQKVVVDATEGVVYDGG